MQDTADHIQHKLYDIEEQYPAEKIIVLRKYANRILDEREQHRARMR